MEPLIHFAAPLAALTALGFQPEVAALFSLLALAPDLDVLFRVHRSISHSLIPLLMAALPLLVFTRGNPGIRGLVLLGLLSVASHLLLDLTEYTPLLYPLVRDSFRLKVDLELHYGSGPRFDLHLGLLSRPTRFKRFRSLNAQLVTGQGLMISLLLLTPILLGQLRRWGVL